MEKHGNLRKLLLMHCEKYPELQIQDIFKFLYQSTFGCEHLVSSLETAVKMIVDECGRNKKKNQTTETLGERFSRVSLSYIDNGLSADTLGRLFVLSSKKEKGELKELKEDLEEVKELSAEGAVPFDVNKLEKEISRWEKNGFESVHHSDIFRKRYCPSYRVISNEYIPFLPLFSALDRLSERGGGIVAVEGGSGSGKTSLGKMLEEVYNCTVLHTDDFFLRPEQRTAERYKEAGGNFDRERFLSEVLEPLRKGENIVYRKFDCSTMSPGEEQRIKPKKLVIIEGVYSLHPETEKYYDFSVFLDISKELQRKRILERNGQMSESFFKKWIPLENIYFEKTGIRQRCDMTVRICQK